MVTWNTGLHSINDSAFWQRSEPYDLFLQCPFNYFGLVNEVRRRVTGNGCLRLVGSPVKALGWSSMLGWTSMVKSDATLAVEGRFHCVCWFLRIQTCTSCPAAAVCIGGVTDPSAREGFFMESRTSYISCTPPEACAGGNNTHNQCNEGYVGVACASCDKVLHINTGTQLARSSGVLFDAYFSGRCF